MKERTSVCWQHLTQSFLKWRLMIRAASRIKPRINIFWNLYI
jgi:hypothetical protein